MLLWGQSNVCKTSDELTKNHRENDRENLSGLMSEIPDSDLCPVKSFEYYLDKLNPGNDKLWQRPKDSFLDTDRFWYNNIPVGQKSLSTFMSKISERCSLSIKYANHSIRATGATLLSRAKFNPAQIMAVTGHKSVSSLAVYQTVRENEKIAMGRAIADFIDKPKHVVPAETNCTSI